MEQKEIKIQVPEGYEIDKGKNTFEKIVFKPSNKYPESWEDTFLGKPISGFYLRGEGTDSYSCKITSYSDKNVFYSEKQAESALAYAQITQLMALPCYNGDWTPDWADNSPKWIISRGGNDLLRTAVCHAYFPIAFKSEEARDAFWNNHQYLLKQYHQL